MSAIIKLENVSFDYDGDGVEPAVHDVDLSIEEGSFVAVLGHNGSGKSTLAKLFNCILTPTSGRVLVDGMDTADETRLFDIRKTVGMVFQNPDNQLVASVVEEDVAFGPENIGLPREEIRRRVDDALEQVGMTEYRLFAPGKLSGGQKQRIAVAGILALAPRCMVLDEATAMLDPQGRRYIMDTVRRLNREKGITVVHITHYMNEASLADRVIVMNDGAVVMDGTPREIFSDVETLEKIGLDVPQSTKLIWKLKHEGGFEKLPDGVFGTDEAALVLSDLMKRPEAYR